MILFVFWLGNRSSREMMEGTGGGGGVKVIQKCVQVRMCTGAYNVNVYRCVQGEKGITPHVHVRTYTVSFFMCLS